METPPTLVEETPPALGVETPPTLVEETPPKEDCTPPPSPAPPAPRGLSTVKPYICVNAACAFCAAVCAVPPDLSCVGDAYAEYLKGKKAMGRAPV